MAPFRQGLVRLRNGGCHALALRTCSTNDILDIEIEAGGTQFSANSDSQTAFATLFDGDLWMIYRNALTDVLHWDFVSQRETMHIRVLT